MARARDEDRWDFWRKVLSDYESSGLSVSKYCRERDLVQGSFYEWRRKIAREASTEKVDPASARTPEFLPVSCPDSASLGSLLEVELPNGVCVKVSRGCDLTLLASLLQAASQVGGADA